MTRLRLSAEPAREKGIRVLSDTGVKYNFLATVPEFTFSCPACGTLGRANKDVSGRERKCGKCAQSYTIAAKLAVADRDTIDYRTPDDDEIYQALQAWRTGRHFVPELFVKDASLGALSRTLRLTLEYKTESRRWIETNGEPAPDPWSIPLPLETPREMCVPGSERDVPCVNCKGSGRTPCPRCGGSARHQCAKCRGRGCVRCASHGVVPCAQCIAAGSAPCTHCNAQGKVKRRNILGIDRSVEHKQRTLGPVPPVVGSIPASRMIPLKHFELTQTNALSPEVRAWEPELRDAAEDLLRSINNPSIRMSSAALFLEQIPVWQGTWRYRNRSGRMWLHGEPLKVIVDSPPRSMLAIAFIGWAAVVLLGVGGFFVSEAIKRERARRTPSTAQQPDAPTSTAPLRLEPVLTFPDAIVVFEETRTLHGTSTFRGRIESSDAYVNLLRDDERERIPQARVRKLIHDGAKYVAEQQSNLLVCEGKVAALRKLVNPPVDIVQPVIREVDGLYSEWEWLAQICRADEIPDGRNPLACIERLVVLLAELTKPPPPDVPPSSDQPPPPPPDTDPVIQILSDLSKAGNEGERRAVAMRLLKLSSTVGPRKDLWLALALIYSQSQRQLGFEIDRVLVKSASVEVQYEGDLEMHEKYRVTLRLSSGAQLEARPRGPNTWDVDAGGGVRVENATLKVENKSRTAAGRILDEHCTGFPMIAWIKALPQEHLSAAKRLVERLRKPAAGPWVSTHLLRTLAAGHALTATEEGTEEQRTAASAQLNELGFILLQDRWHAPPDHEIAGIGKAWRIGGLKSLPSAFLPSTAKRNFSNTYPWFALRMLQSVLRNNTDVAALLEVARTTLGLASSPIEGRHIQSVVQRLNGVRPCSRCDGSNILQCTECKGRGEKNLVCGTCNGKGEIFKVGNEGGMVRCSACGGSPQLGTQQCEKCRGHGRLRCTDCPAPFAYPKAEELVATRDCNFCERKGSFGRSVLVLCPACRGLGFFLIPKPGPSLEGEPFEMPAASSVALETALDWLMRHQSDDGGWESRNFQHRCNGATCADGMGGEEYRVGVTALAALAMLGPGSGIQDSTPQAKSLKRAIEYILKNQTQTGSFRTSQDKKQIYEHAIATLAVAEALRSVPRDSKTAEDSLRQALNRAVRLLLEAQNSNAAWRYGMKPGDNDTSVTAWVLQALVAAERVGESVPASAFRDAFGWIEQATDENTQAVGYNAKGTRKVFVPGRNEQFDHHPTHTAAAGLCRALSNQGVHGDAKSLVLNDLPSRSPSAVDSYYWHYGTRFIKECGSANNWRVWSAAVTTALESTQVVDGCQRGSWPSEERWACEGGRVYVTAINAMTLAQLREAPPRKPTDDKKPPLVKKWTFVLKSGGKLRVDSYEEKGDSYVLTLSGGATATVTKASVERIEKGQ